MLQPPNIVTADTFIAFMERVWAMNTSPGTDGGLCVAMPDPDAYDRWHDARKTARKLGGKRARFQTFNGMLYEVMDFGPHERVYLSMDGAGVRKVNRLR